MELMLMFLSGCLAALKTFCIGSLLLFSPGTQTEHPQVVMAPPPVCTMDEAQTCEMLNTSSYGFDNPRLVQFFSENPDCPPLLEQSTTLSALYGCDVGDEVCFSSLKVHVYRYLNGQYSKPKNPKEAVEKQSEVDFIGATLQRRCDQQHKPFVWDPSDLERREFAAGYRAKKE
jgi:hypothetical protein